MTAGGHVAHAATLRDYLHVARRRKWIILQAVVLVPLHAIIKVEDLPCGSTTGTGKKGFGGIAHTGE